jgi:hypothetical protein
MYVLLILVCPFILFLFAIVLSVLRFTDSDYLPLVSSNSSYTWRKFKSEILYNVWNVVTLYKQGLWLWRLIYTFVYHIWNSRLWLDDLLSTLLTQLYVKVDILLYHSAADTVICEGWHFTVLQRCWYSYMWRLTFYCITALLTVICEGWHFTVSQRCWHSYMWRLTFYCITALLTVICEGWHFTVSQRCWHSYMWRLTFYCITAVLTQLYVKVDISLTCMWKTFAWPLYFIMKRGDGSMNLFQLRHFLVKCLLKDRNVSQDIDFVSVSTIFRLYFLTVAVVYYICFSFYIWYILRFFFIFFLERLNYVQTHISVSPEFSITNLTNPRYKSTANPYFVKPCVSTWLSLILIYIRINNFPCRTIDFLTRIIFFLLYFQIKLTRADSELVSRIILWISINSNLINYMYKTLKFMF